ncbi:uncharacterized protein LOC122906724 [Neovison vison]|uniref:uncharacterized protein LOC122906724 n=1 Tax=Neovison vison TaxID=452646 RepID=UPI001CF09E4C|nr:uncharacterized protein LOC122906724 [Neogale vison]
MCLSLLSCAWLPPLPGSSACVREECPHVDVGHPCTPGAPQPACLGTPSPWAGHPCPPAAMCQELQVRPCPHIRHSCKCALPVDLLVGSLLSSVHVPLRPPTSPLVSSLPPASLTLPPWILAPACLSTCSSCSGVCLPACLLLPDWLAASFSGCLSALLAVCPPLSLQPSVSPPACLCHFFSLRLLVCLPSRPCHASLSGFASYLSPLRVTPLVYAWAPVFLADCLLRSLLVACSCCRDLGRTCPSRGFSSVGNCLQRTKRHQSPHGPAMHQLRQDVGAPEDLKSTASVRQEETLSSPSKSQIIR